MGKKYIGDTFSAHNFIIKTFLLCKVYRFLPTPLYDDNLGFDIIKHHLASENNFG